MRYGKIRIEDGFFVFTRHMMLNSLPCKDILWAYMRREGTDKTGEKQLIINYLVIITRRQKRYKFDMTEQEVQDCLQLLKVLFRLLSGLLLWHCEKQQLHSLHEAGHLENVHTASENTHP